MACNCGCDDCNSVKALGLTSSIAGPRGGGGASGNMVYGFDTNADLPTDLTAYSNGDVFVVKETAQIWKIVSGSLVLLSANGWSVVSETGAGEIDGYSTSNGGTASVDVGSRIHYRRIADAMFFECNINYSCTGSNGIFIDIGAMPQFSDVDIISGGEIMARSVDNGGSFQERMNISVGTAFGSANLNVFNETHSTMINQVSGITAFQMTLRVQNK